MSAVELTFGDAAPFGAAETVDDAVEFALHHEFAQRDRPVYVVGECGRAVAVVRHDRDVQRFDS